MPLRIIYISLIFILSLTGSLFTVIKIGSYSLSAFITLSALLVPILFIKKSMKKSIIKIIFPFLIYCIYDLSDFLFGPVTKSVLQDFTVWVGMLMLFLISSIPLNSLHNYIIYIMDIIKYPFLAFLSYFLLVNIDSPATMMLSTLFFSYYLSKFITKRISNLELIIMIYLFIVPIVTGSRIIYITEIILVFIFITFFYGSKYSTKDKFKKILFIIFSFFIVISIAFTLEDKISAVMSKGDGANVAGISVNTSGRSYIWSIVFESAQRNIIFGLGEDGPPEMLKYPKWAHPHNDYLRLLHHNGIIGLVLWMAFFAILFVYLLKRIKNTSSNEYRGYYLFNFSFLFSILIIMITDNPIVYSYVMYPLMILSGSSIALSRIENIMINKKEVNENV